MRTDSRASRGAGLTLIEVVIVILILAAMAGVVLPGLARRREEARRIRCRNNLNQLAKGMATYLNPHDGRFFPCPLGRTRSPNTYNGAEWLAALYWTGVVPDPGVFICPSSGDTNREGVDIGTRVQAATFGSQTVSYAAMHYNSDRTEAGAIRDDYPPNKPMGSDDTQGDINHGTLRNGGMSVLFFDSHVEFRTNTELDLRHAVGDTSPDALLTELSN
jgi:prepilin-type processing-associated H-X9-DG protein